MRVTLQQRDHTHRLPSGGSGGRGPPGGSDRVGHQRRFRVSTCTSAPQSAECVVANVDRESS
jgi:hypothetical protein